MTWARHPKVGGLRKQISSIKLRRDLGEHKGRVVQRKTKAKWQRGRKRHMGLVKITNKAILNNDQQTNSKKTKGNLSKKL